MAALLHPDGMHRCAWPGEDKLYVAYHDDEWGVPEHDDRALYEKLGLEGFQAGPPGSRSCASARSSAKCSTSSTAEDGRYWKRESARLMTDAGIIRKRGKIDAAIFSGAQIWLDIMEKEPGGFSEPDLETRRWKAAGELIPRDETNPGEEPR